MSARPLPRVFGLLATERSRAVDEALIEALPHVEGDVRSASLELLCKHARPASLAAVISRLPAYDAELQDAVLRRIGDFHAGVRAAVESSRFEDRAAAVEAIAASDDDKSAYLLADALRSNCPRTRELAAKAIHRMAAAHLERREGGARQRGNGATGQGGDEGSAAKGLAEVAARERRLAELLQSVVRNWESHLHVMALEAALWMIDETEEVIIEKLAQPHSRILHALKEILEGASDRRLARFAVQALAVTELRSSGASALSKARNLKFVGGVIEEVWLLGDPAIEHGCRYVRDSGPIERWIAETAGIDDRRAKAAARWIDATGGSRERVQTALMELADSESGSLRRAAVWRLVEDESDAATDLLARISLRHRDVAGDIAEREFRRRRPASIGRAGASPARRAELQPARTKALERYVEEFERLTPAERDSLGRQLAEVVPDLRERVAAKLESSNPLDRATALRMIPALGLKEAMAERVYRCVHDSDALVRAAAVALLEGFGNATAARLIRGATNDPDARVQATAVEALGRIDGAAHARTIEGKLESSDNRVRANAIKALVEQRLDRAVGALLEMLGHRSRAHRISALWVVERMRLREMTERVATMCRGDEDPRVRARARRVMRHLSGRVSAGGGASIGGVA